MSVTLSDNRPSLATTAETLLASLRDTRPSPEQLFAPIGARVIEKFLTLFPNAPVAPAIDRVRFALHGVAYFEPESWNKESEARFQRAATNFVWEALWKDLSMVERCSSTERPSLVVDAVRRAQCFVPPDLLNHLQRHRPGIAVALEHVLFQPINPDDYQLSTRALRYLENKLFPPAATTVVAV